MRQSQLYCNYHPDKKWSRRYKDFHKGKIATKVSASVGAILLQVNVTEATEDDQEVYYAWWEEKDQRFIFVYPTYLTVSMCFAYGPEPEIVKGRGNIYRVTIQHIEETK